MGAKIHVNMPQANITGPTELFGSKVEATDLRCGASLVIAGLMADGITEIDEIYHIDRGYDNLDDKLNALGAKIWREDKVQFPKLCEGIYNFIKQVVKVCERLAFSINHAMKALSLHIEST